MNFAHPQLLWLLWLLPTIALLAWGSARRRRRDLAAFADEAVIARLVPPRASEAGRLALLLAAVAGLVVAAAGPRWGYRWHEVKRHGVDVVVALDLSRSMLAEDLKPNRLDAARQEIRDLLALLRGDRVGLVVFAGTALTQVPLTLDYGAFEVFLDQLDPDWVPVGGTDLAAAVRQAMAAFPEETGAGKAVILITDGEDHGGELKAAAEEAAAAEVHVFVVGIGDPAGAPVPDGRGGFVQSEGQVVLSRLDEPALKELALTTSASYVRASPTTLDLERIYVEDIRGTLQARQLASARRKQWEERFGVLLLPAILLLVMESLLRPRRARLGAALLLLALPRPASAGWLSVDPLTAGWKALVAGDAERARDLLVAAQVEHPADRRIDYDLAHAHAALADWPAAEAAFASAAQSPDPDLAADAWFGVGNARFQQGRFLEAMAAYDQVLDRRPDDADALANRALAERRMQEAREQAQQDQQARDQQEPSQDPPQEPSQQDEQEPSDAQDGQAEGEERQQEQQEQQSGAASQQSEPGEEGEQGEQADERPTPGEADEGEEQAGADAGNTDAQQAQERQGQRAEAAEIDREGQTPTAEPDGALAEQTEPDGSGQDVARVAEGAMSATGAESLLQAYAADKEQRQRERTRREATRGRRAAGKDW